MEKIVNLSMEKISPIIAQCVESGSEVILTVTGNSMRPFLVDKRDQVVLIKADVEALKEGDVPLYQRRNGKYVLHRMVKKENGSYTMLGDAQVDFEKGIMPDQIIAVAKAFIRKGKRYECDSEAYCRYVKFWKVMLPLRKIYFFAKRVFFAVLRRVKKLIKKIFPFI